MTTQPHWVDHRGFAPLHDERGEQGSVLATQPEVRRCEACGDAAVLEVQTWEHSFMGESTGETTRDFRCQSCGAGFSLRSSRWELVVWALLLLPVGVGAVLLLVAWRRSRKSLRNPVVPGASLPPVRYRELGPVRRCRSCSAPCTAIGITRTAYNGIPMGSEVRYRCSSCQTEFTIDSLWRQATGVAAALLLINLGWTGLASTTWWRFAAAALGLGGLVVAVQRALRAWRATRCPVIEDGDAAPPRESRALQWLSGA